MVSLPKRTSVSRGLYYCSKVGEASPTLVLLHGFPSSPRDGANQIAFFKAKGVCLISANLLGYGGTDKPIGFKKYVLSGLVQGVVDILDTGGIQTTIRIHHDW